jgi:hypothetical protein
MLAGIPGESSLELTSGEPISRPGHFPAPSAHPCQRGPFMNRMQFFEPVTRAADRYDADNAWFGFRGGGPAWSRGTWTQFIVAAWKLYEKASPNQLQMVLLGDTKIRFDQELLRNFGLVANAQTPQEAADLALACGPAKPSNFAHSFAPQKRM